MLAWGWIVPGTMRRSVSTLSKTPGWATADTIRGPSNVCPRISTGSLNDPVASLVTANTSASTSHTSWIGVEGGNPSPIMVVTCPGAATGGNASNVGTYSAS